MIELKRIKTSEDSLVIYHYLYGELLGGYKERFFTWTRDEVSEFVLNKRDTFTTWDFRVTNNDKLMGIISFSNIDYENLNAKLDISIIDYSNIDREEIIDILHEAIKFAFYQIGIIRIQGITVGDKYNEIIKLCGFKQEAVLKNAGFKNGMHAPINYFGLLKEDYEELNKYAV